MFTAKAKRATFAAISGVLFLTGCVAAAPAQNLPTKAETVASFKAIGFTDVSCASVSGKPGEFRCTGKDLSVTTTGTSSPAGGDIGTATYKSGGTRYSIKADAAGGKSDASIPGNPAKDRVLWSVMSAGTQRAGWFYS